MAGAQDGLARTSLALWAVAGMPDDGWTPQIS